MAGRHLDKDDRREQRYQRLGTREPVCMACPESDPRCLEDHHVAGRKLHGDTAMVCRNCHRKLSDDQLDHAPEGQRSMGQLARIGHYLLGLCDLLLMVVATLRNFGEWLISEARVLEAPS